MKQFFFVIRDNKIDYIDFNIITRNTEYTQFYDTSVKEKVVYKFSNGDVSNIICEADCIASAIGAVEKFLSYQRIYKVA
jgi:hypothetical protein